MTHNKRPLFVNIILALLAIMVLWSIVNDRNRIYLGAGFSYYRDIKSVLFWNVGDTTNRDIPPTVLAYKKNQQYIVIKQKPKEYENVMYPQYNYSAGRDTVYYWIINKNTKQVSGPLERKDFMALTEGLQIPKSLLKCILP